MSRRRPRHVRREGETLEESYARRRPWRVHVHDIGPNYAYATEERAHARAAALVSPEGPDRYATVTVWHSGVPARPGPLYPLERTVYRWDRGPVVEQFGPDTGYSWIRKPTEQEPDQ